METLSIIKSEYFKDYLSNQKITLQKHFGKITKTNSNLGIESIDFYFSGSAVYSSMIEGNKIDLDSYLKYHYSGMNNKGKSFLEIEDLKAAYSFAKKNKLSKAKLFEAHKILSKTFIEDTKYRGKLRDKEVYIFKNGLKIYTGAATKILKTEIELFFKDIAVLQKKAMQINEVFYYASMLHLTFAHIHPFADGNGRTARLIEKWFLAEKLGENAWFILSEKLYQKLILNYYKNINIGNSYNTLNHNICMDFLLMLPMSLRLKI